MTAHAAHTSPVPEGCPAPIVLTKAGRFLSFPVGCGETLHRLDIDCDGKPYTELLVPDGESLYRAAVLLPDECRTLTLHGAFSPAFAAGIGFCAGLDAPAAGLPLAHYAPPQGWCNDPNGLICEKGQYLFYYQYNPCGTKWNNMSWGAASTKDFLHWETQPAVLLPDSRGSVFSGCGIRNEHALLGLPADALLYFYTAAGQAYECADKTALWSAGKPFTQNWAYSLDGGRTIVRPEHNELIGDLGCDARDPKVFWYAPKGYYCMVLFLDGNRFELRHSADLLHWEKTQELELPGSWECPDLFPLPAPDGGERWVFWSADGYYYLGAFDGEYYHTDCVRHLAYRTALPYAAQTWSGTAPRVLSIPWMRTKNPGRSFTGLYGVPREFSLVQTSAGLTLCQRPAAEFAAALHAEASLASGEAWHTESEQAIFLHTATRDAVPVKWTLYGSCYAYDPRSGVFSGEGAQFYLAPALTDFTLIFDRGILELTAAHDTLFAAVETDCYTLSGDVCVEGDTAHTRLCTPSL